MASRYHSPTLEIDKEENLVIALPNELYTFFLTQDNLEQKNSNII